MVLHYEETGRLVNGHDRGITTVAFSPQGTHIATAGLDGRICVWDVSNLQLLYIFEGGSPVLSLIWLTPGANTMLCGFLDGNMAVLKISSDRIYVQGFYAHNYPVECLAARADDRQLASGAHGDLFIWRWDQDDGALILVRDISEVCKKSRTATAEPQVTSIHWTSSHQHPHLLLVTYMYHGLVLLDSSTWTRIRTIPLRGPIADASLSEDGTRLAISNVIRGFDVYSMQSGAPLCTIEHGDRSACPIPVLFIHGGLALIGGSTTGELNIWDVMHTESNLPMLNTPEVDDAQPQVIYTLAVPQHAKVLAVDAYYDDKKDEFLVAAGTMNESSASIAILWSAVEEGHSGVDEAGESDAVSGGIVPGSGRTLLLALALVVCAVLLPYAWDLVDATDVH